MNSSYAIIIGAVVACIYILHDSSKVHTQLSELLNVENLSFLDPINNLTTTAMTTAGRSLPWTSFSSSLGSGTNTDDDQESQRPKHNKPLNVIVFYPDDIRHDTMSCAGTQPHVYTPFFDQLAREGIRFTQNAVTTSICWISRATLFSGQYVSRHGAELLKTPLNVSQWNHTYPTLLRKAGYYTGHVGKWQYHDMNAVKNYFDYANIFEGHHVFRGRENKSMPMREMHNTEKCEYEAINFLQKRPKDKPFALQVAFYAPKAVGAFETRPGMQWTPTNKTAHMYQNITIEYPPGVNASFDRLPKFFREFEIGFPARQRWRQRFGTPLHFDQSMKRYYRMITELDEACRRIYEELERQKILDDTMVIYTSDNGFFHSEHGLSGKWFPYQESIRVPLIIRDPRIPKSKIGTTDDSFTLNIDLASTILGAAGLPPDPGMQGRDIADLYFGTDRDASSWREEFYYEWPGMARAIPESNALVRKDWKLFVYPTKKVEQLFNLKDDPLEEFDLIDKPENKELVEEMRARYFELQEQAKRGSLV